MGVPKFYRWLSERYPCLSQVIKEHQIPEFDNLYLDMNGIIHPCSHPNDDDPHFRITEAEIFKNIFNYIEVLFRIIKPQQNFFMAVDGCAPRAKMNQQRSRRFRTAKEAEDSIRKALLKGQTLPKEDRFDSNCITPGTEFMARLQVQLKYFVNQKISTDPLWQKCSVYLSGHDVPGEGEHKVMDFIRYCKSKPGYDPNTRHCLYGLDADLIMLGLTTHEPHFCLLREEVRFGKQAKRLTRPEQQTFHLLHLSLMREYLDMEFSSLKSVIHFRYEIERIIDDWILLGFLVGNDFIPHLPHMHINHDALPYLFGVYKEFIQKTDGYLNEGGYINLNRLKKFFIWLSKFDSERFNEVYADLKWLESKGAGKLLEGAEKTSPDKGKKKKFSEFLKTLDNDYPTPSPVKQSNPYAALANISGAFDEFSFAENPQTPAGAIEKPNTDCDDGDDVEVKDEETFELEFQQHKRHYYMEKFDMDIVDNGQIQTICYEYVRALQWIAHYYFNGLQSWSWYYPYHYSPYISDIANFDITELHYDMGKSFHPFEQLLAVLPAASRKLLPEAFQSLMVMDNSPIIDFYPPDFRTDLNGKQQEWEAVVLIPFIDETRLLKAMGANYSRLTDEEKGRNSFGCCHKYNYDKMLNFFYPSSYPQHFDDITCCKTKVEEIDKDLYRLNVSQVKKGLLKGTNLDVYYHGFPTMKHLKHKSYLKKAGVKVFQHNSRNENTIVKIVPDNVPSIEELAKQLVGETAYVEWPYMVEALVMSVCNSEVKYYLDHNHLASKLIQGEAYNSVKREMKAISTYHMGRRGIEIGEVTVMIEAKLLLGQRYVCGQKGKVTLEKEWQPQSNFYAHQVVVKNLAVNSKKEDIFDSIDKLYPPSSICFMMGNPHYGCSGEVIECDKEAGRVRVALKVKPEPDFLNIIKKYDSLSVHYISDRAVSQRLGISTHLLSWITGDVYICEDVNIDGRNGKVNIGLKLKYSGQNKEVLGFARRSDNGWTYSPITIDILTVYMKKFPEVFQALGRTRNHDTYVFSDLWPNKSKQFLQDIKSFLKSQPCHNAEAVRCGSNVLDEPVVREIGKNVEKTKTMKGEKKIVKVKVKPYLLFRSTGQFGKLPPDPSTEFLLLDRVVNVQNGITVPCGLRGTIIGIHSVLTDDTDKNSATETRYEILFDETFLGAVEMRSQDKRCYFMSGNSLLNLSHGERKDKNPLTSPMAFQNKISQTPGSHNTQRTPGIIHTPTQILLNPSNRRGNQTNSPYQTSNIKEGLVSPDYWLKGRYVSRTSYATSSPQYQPKQQYNSPNLKKMPAQKNYDSFKDNSDFMSMWEEMQKTEAACKQPEKRNVDQNATAVLQQMLNIGSSQSPQQPNVSLQQSTKQQLNQPMQQHSANLVTNLFSSPQVTLPAVSVPFMSKGTPNIGGIQSTVILQQWCVATNFPQPQYTYSRGQQGYSAFVMIGHSFQISGGVCATQLQAVESAASVALVHMNQFYSAMKSPFRFSINPVQVGGSFLQQQFLQQPRQLYQSPFRTSPQQYGQSRQQNRPHHSYSQGNVSASTKQPNYQVWQNKSDSAINEQNDVPQKNPFVPHQVVVKNRPPQKPADNQQNADNEIKGLLGIKIKGKDEELKDILGIGKRAVKNDDVYLKDILGVKPASDDEKLKGLLGIQTSESIKLDHVPVLPSPLNEEVTKPSTSPLIDLISSCNISSNINPVEDKTENTLQQTTSPNTSARNSQTSTSLSDGIIKKTRRSQILLAPSFFGPKQK